MRMNTKSATLAAAGTVLLWASAFPAITVAVRGLGPAGLAVARLAVASAVLALAAPLMGVRRPKLRDLPLIALCGLAGMTGYQLLLNAGERVVPAGTASLWWRPRRCTPACWRWRSWASGPSAGTVLTGTGLEARWRWPAPR